MQLLQAKVEAAQEAETKAKDQVQKHELELTRQTEELKAELVGENLAGFSLHFHEVEILISSFNCELNC